MYFAHCLWGHHRHLRNIDCPSFVMCPLLALVLIVNRLLFFFFFFCCSHLQNYWSKQGRRYAPLSSLYYLDVYGCIIKIFWSSYDDHHEWHVYYKDVLALASVVNSTAFIRHQCRKTAVLNWHRCLINTGVEKMNSIWIWIRTLTPRCL